MAISPPPDLPITSSEHPTFAGHLGGGVGVPDAANEAVQPPDTTPEMGASLTNELTHPNMSLSLQTAVQHTASSEASPAVVNCGDHGENLTGVVLMFVEEAVGLKNFPAAAYLAVVPEATTHIIVPAATTRVVVLLVAS